MLDTGLAHDLIIMITDKLIIETDRSRYPSKPSEYQLVEKPAICLTLRASYAMVSNTQTIS